MITSPVSHRWHSPPLVPWWRDHPGGEHREAGTIGPHHRGWCLQTQAPKCQKVAMKWELLSCLPGSFHWQVGWPGGICCGVSCLVCMDVERHLEAVVAHPVAQSPASCWRQQSLLSPHLSSGGVRALDLSTRGHFLGCSECHSSSPYSVLQFLSFKTAAVLSSPETRPWLRDRFHCSK